MTHATRARFGKEAAPLLLWLGANVGLWLTADLYARWLGLLVLGGLLPGWLLFERLYEGEQVQADEGLLLAGGLALASLTLGGLLLHAIPGPLSRWMISLAYNALVIVLHFVRRRGGAHGARIVGTGVNPGFVMDVLPVCLTGVCREVRAVHVQRVVNATTRRGPLQRKIGSGWTPEEFERRFQAGTAGHAGLKESLALIAHSLGWEITDLVDTGKAVVADHDIRTPHVEVKAGQCCGHHQYAEAKRDGKVCLTLDIKMYLDAPNPHDACQIDGEPPLNLLIQGGVAGDAATAASVVNAAPRVLKAPPGLLLMTDLAVPCCA